MTPLEWTNEAIARHTTLRLNKKLDAQNPSKSDYSRALDYGQMLSYDYFLSELDQLKKLLVP